MKHTSSSYQPLNFSAYQKPLSWLTVLRKTTKHIQLAAFLVLLPTVGLGIAAVIAMNLSNAGNAFSMVVVGLFFFVVPLLRIRNTLTQHFAHTKRAMRLRGFAAANNFAYQAVRSETLPGMLSAETAVRFETVLSGTYHSLPFAIGNACFVRGSGKERSEIWYGVIHVRLTRRVPHILLDCRRNNSWGMSNFPSLRRSQRLKLEGNFNKYFDLYVPKGYERDALYFITPELMAMLIDQGAAFDVELIDNNLLIYSNRAFPLEEATVLSNAFQMIDRIGAEFQENTRRYADANVGNQTANIVAEPGKRLQRSWPWLLAVVIFLYILSVIFD